MIAGRFQTTLTVSVKADAKDAEDVKPEPVVEAEVTKAEKVKEKETEKEKEESDDKKPEVESKEIKEEAAPSEPVGFRFHSYSFRGWHEIFLGKSGVDS